MNDRIDALVASAISAGLLPADAVPTAEQDRPWPVLIFTALGAWLAAIPLCIVPFLAFKGILVEGVGPFVLGGLLLAASVAVLRKKNLPLFLEQLLIPALLVGGGVFSYGLVRETSNGFALLATGTIALGVAWLVPRNCLRILLGASAASCFCMAIASPYRFEDTLAYWAALHAIGAIWIYADWLSRTSQTISLDRVAVGWALITLVGLAAWSGMAFLVSGSLGESGFPRYDMDPELHAIVRTVSCALAGVALTILAQAWPALRRPVNLLGAAIVLTLASLMPSLGATLLILAITARNGRYLMAGAAGVAAAWILGAFYYALSYPLATKALMLTGAGVILGLQAWLGKPGQPSEAPQAPATANPLAVRAGIAFALIAVLGIANLGIWQKEILIATGRPVYVALAPADPRSLMQGDYMRLNFLGNGEAWQLRKNLKGAERPMVVAKIDRDGVATIARQANPAEPLAANEILIELTPKGNGYTVVTDAWYFKEGEAGRWAKAGYGEFRIQPDGKALLVDLRGPHLEKL